MNFKVNTNPVEPFERIEFAFVLLPSNTELQHVLSLAQTVHYILHDAELSNDIPCEWGSYHNQALRMPHLSIGQYGILGTELDILKSIVHDISAVTPVITQSMNDTLSILDDYIFFDSTECFEKVNTHISTAYQRLRALYFKQIQTRFPIAQALLAKQRCANDPLECELIERCFQNWGTPEENRMRPHFTLHYHSRYVNESMHTILDENKSIKMQLASLSTITLTHLGIVRIDTFGNPVANGLLCSYPLAHAQN